MEYYTPETVAKNWGISPRTVHAYCANNKIPGVIRAGKHYLIPKTAQKPLDGRKKAARASKDVEPYHFPAFVFSRFYVDTDELSEDESLLLDAQILYLKGEWVQCVQNCRTLIAQTVSESVRFGAYWIVTLCFLHLGLPYETNNHMHAMAVICEKSSEHREDYHLLMTYCNLLVNLDSKEYFTIDPLKICNDALLFYGCISLLFAFLSSKSESPCAMAFYTTFCREAGMMGIHPVQLIAHSCIAGLSTINRDETRKIQHIREACKIGYDCGFNSLLVQFSLTAVDTFDQEISLYGKDFNKKFCNFRRETLKQNTIVTMFNRSRATILEGCSPSEFEIMILLASQKTISVIAKVKNISEKKIREQIKILCARCGLRTKKELENYCKELFGTLSQEDTMKEVKN